MKNEMIKKKKVIFVFIDDIFICNLDGGFFSRYSVENNNLIATNPDNVLFEWADSIARYLQKPL
jgi:hypothetical protein